MIDESLPVFPNNVAETIRVRFEMPGVIDDEVDPTQRITILKRPLRPTDPNQSVGLIPVNWVPNQESLEIRGLPSPGPQEPTLQQYMLHVQAFVRDPEEMRGLAVHSVLTSRIRAVLYRDVPLRVGLAALAVNLVGATEQLKRWGFLQTRYLSNEVNGNWLYLSTTELWIETETT